MRRYGYDADADRISVKFLKLVLEAYLGMGTIVEKYDVVHGGSNIAGGILYGYHSNEIGFGWTNAAFTALYDRLPEGEGAKLKAVKAAAAQGKR